jgi:hypothetical protein
MARPMKFLCTVLASATLSQAIRRDFKMDRTPINVVDGISALMQKHATTKGAKSAMQILEKAQKAMVGITPGAKGAMDTALQGVITDIEANVETMIREQHTSTQGALDTALQALSTATDTALEAKTLANSADNAFVACIETEKGRLAAVEGAQASLVAAQEAKIQPCADQDAAAPYSKEFSENDLVFECDISIRGNCDGPLADFTGRVNSLLTGLEADVSSATGVYTAAKGRCDSAKAAIVAAQGALVQAQGDFSTQRQQCMQSHESRQVSLCMFGMDLSAKCDSASAFKALEAQIDGSGSIHSEPDRMAEWTSTEVTKCMLRIIIDADDLANVNLDESSLATCAQAVDYVGSVGSVDRKAGDFAVETGPDRFTCTETQISFSGFSWSVPVATEDTVVQSSQYEKQQFAVPVNTGSGAKFEFCAVTQ